MCQVPSREKAEGHGQLDPYTAREPHTHTHMHIPDVLWGLLHMDTQGYVSHLTHVYFTRCTRHMWFLGVLQTHITSGVVTQNGKWLVGHYTHTHTHTHTRRQNSQKGGDGGTGRTCGFVAETSRFQVLNKQPRKPSPLHSLCPLTGDRPLPTTAPRQSAPRTFVNHARTRTGLGESLPCLTQMSSTSMT